MTFLVIENATVIKGKRTLLDNLNLTVEEGEFIVIVGPSGCGKSTLLRTIAGLEPLTSGRVFLKHQNITSLEPAKRNMAMVFQHYALYPHMTVFKNMAYGMMLRGINKQIIKSRVHAVADTLNLSDYLTYLPKQLSGGQRQRVAIGRALVRSPSLFLFDEPLSNLDASLRARMRQEIKSLHQQVKTTSLYVTHDFVEAMTMATRVVVLNDGKIVQMGTPQQIYEKPASLFVAGLLGGYPLNCIDVRVDVVQRCLVSEFDKTWHLPKLCEEVDHNAPLILAVRAEHIKLSTFENPDALLMQVEFIDEYGADRVIRGRTIVANVPIALRTDAKEPLTGQTIPVEIDLKRVNIYHKTTQCWLGGWDE